MAKISRPVVYSFVGAVVVYAIFFLTQPDAPVTKRHIHVTRVVHAASEDFTQEDLTAHFARYPVGKRNPFLPALLLGGAPTAHVASGGPGGWTLTGINIINGVPNALVENPSANDSVFLEPGDGWKGLRVVSIGSDTVVFVNALGQQTHLSFQVTEKDAGKIPAAGSPFRLPPGVSALPPLPIGPGSIRPLPPMAGMPGR